MENKETKTKKNRDCLIITIFLIVIIAMCVLTKDTINNLRFNSAHCYLKEYWVPDILNTVRVAFFEEIVWRFVPLLILSMAILLAKVLNSKSIMILLHIIACAFLVLVNLQFAYIHTRLECNVTYWELAMIHGSAGIYFCAAYILPIILTIKTLIKKTGSITNAKKFFTVIGLSNIVGLTCAIITHIISNIIIIFLHTYHPSC